MLEVKPNKEILKIETSINGVTPWQIAWMIAGIAAGSAVYFLLPFPAALRAPLIMPVVVLFCSVGFVKIDGKTVFGMIAAMWQTWRINRHPLLLRDRKEDFDDLDQSVKEK